MATTSWVTPSERTSKACSLVCPPDSKPDSNEPIVASTTRTATSAYERTIGQMYSKDDLKWS